jgi:putative transposase
MPPAPHELKGALLEKTPNADLLREMIGFGPQRLMELEVVSLIDASYGQKSPGCLVQRNGYATAIGI